MQLLMCSDLVIMFSLCYTALFYLFITRSLWIILVVFLSFFLSFFLFYVLFKKT